MTDITPYLLDKEIIRETMQRIITDFEFFDIQLFYSGNEKNAYNEAYQQLIKVIDDVSLNNASLLMQIIYKIDISEQTLKNFTDKNPDKNFAECLSHLIIEREMQKVITRKLFK